MRLLVNHARAAVLLGKEMRLEEFLRHRRRDAVAPARAAAPPGSPARPCGSDGWTRRSPGRRDRAGARALRRAVHANTRASGRIQVGRLTRRTRARGHDRFHAGKSTGSAGGASLVAARSTSVRSWPTIARFGERAFVDARLERVLERDHQLDALERAEPELLERRLRREIRRGRRTSRPARRARRCRAARARGAAPPLCTQSRIAARFSLRVPSVRGSSGSGQTSARRIF